MVTMNDLDGFPINLIYGQVQDAQDESRIPRELVLNYEIKKERIGAYQRFTKGPAAVHRVSFMWSKQSHQANRNQIGHFGICMADFAKAFDFYVHTFNLVPSDIVYIDANSQRTDVAAFFHIDRGMEYTDHHTFFMGQSARQRVHHTSFEVHDFDTQLLGHQ